MKIACYIRNSAVSEHVRSVLARANHESVHFDNEPALLRSIRRSAVDMILIDLGAAPREDNSILSWLNLRSGDKTPVIILSPIKSPDLAALALNSGADDFVPRPFEPVELTARINALHRRATPAGARRSIAFAGYLLDRDSGRCSFEGTEIELTPREFSMAWLFFSSPGIYISRDTIGASIWSADSEVAGRTIEQHVYKLRKKLQVGERKVVMIRTAYTQGYRLELCAPE
ncbi:DNA-binding response OmpR family regulator [Pseudoduganella flava]|uniref:DNA-binding response OmpR family regulator n=1 Tax=Pseudoduganella flava TaxID=871742 RepID=A0A562PDG6_9BURK|nr:response regulator transcription factor [Pseudoduganella flava]QGZ42155.1 response regulator [Pseudoduganella flava]TWI42467.1 DNA-binding response OmpR family regulator [Pseudoduganella flava]